MGGVRPLVRPWIGNTQWFDAVTATPDTIRAALFAGEGARVRKQWSMVEFVNSYGRGMFADRERRGWVIKIGRVGSRPDLCAAHHGSSLVGRRIRTYRLLSLFRNVGDYFTWEDTEKIMIEFLERPADPPSAAWVQLEWR